MPDNREIATAILLLGFVVFGLAVRGARKRFVAVVAPPVASEASDHFRNNEDVTVRRRSQCPHR